MRNNQVICSWLLCDLITDDDLLSSVTKEKERALEEGEGVGKGQKKDFQQITLACVVG